MSFVRVPDLTPRERSLVTLALLAMLGHEEELALHLRATRNTGAMPAANSAFRVAKRVLAEE